MGEDQTRSEPGIALEVYRNTSEIWRFEVDSYWHRNNYFAAFETAALAGCWYLLERNRYVVGLTFSVLGTFLTAFWFWNNIAVHRYIKYWWEALQISEAHLDLGNRPLNFATKHPGSNLKPSLAAKMVPLMFAAAWIFLDIYSICHLCGCGK